MELGKLCSFFCWSVCCFISMNANMRWYPLEHNLVILGQGAQAVVKLPGGEVSGARCEGLEGRQGIGEEHNMLLV